MFEDLIGKRPVIKTIEPEIGVDYDIQKQCPHCKTSNIVKRTLERFFMLGATHDRQPAYCPKCRKLWYIVNDEDTNSSHIQHMSKKSEG